MQQLTDSRASRIGVLLNLASILMMGVVPVLGRMAVHDAEPVAIAFAQNAYSAAFGALIALASRMRGRQNTEPSEVNWSALIGAALTNAVGSLLLYNALAMVGPVVVGFFGRLVLVFGLGFAVLWFGERLRLRESLWLTASLLVAFWLAAPGASLPLSGCFAAAGYAFFFAMSNAFMKKASPGLGAAAVMAACSAASAVVVGGYAFTASGAAALAHGFATSLPLASAMALLQAIGMILYLESVSRLSFTSINLMRTLTPFVVATYASFVFPDALKTINWTAAGLMTFFLAGYAYEKSR